MHRDTGWNMIFVSVWLENKWVTSLCCLYFSFPFLTLGTPKVSRGLSKDHLKELVSEKMFRNYFGLRVKPFLGSFLIFFSSHYNLLPALQEKRGQGEKYRTKEEKKNKIRLLNIWSTQSPFMYFNHMTVSGAINCTRNFTKSALA